MAVLGWGIPLGLLIRGRRIGKHFTCLIMGMGLMSDSTQGEQGVEWSVCLVPFPPPAYFLQGYCGDGISITVIPLSVSQQPGRSMNEPQRFRTALCACNRFYPT